MDCEGLQGRRLLQKLKESRSRFQTHMQRLIAKYNQPFEDDPLVDLATLTYETPQGLRIWGGKLIKERNKEQTQDPSVKVIGSLNGQAPEGSECLQPCTQVPGADSESSNAETSLDLDILLQGAEYFKNAEKGDRKDKAVTWSLSLTSPVTPAPGCQDTISEKSFGGPNASASSSGDQGSSYPCPADMTVVPRNDSFLLETISEKSFGDPNTSASSSGDQGSSYPCPADMTVVPRNDSFLLGTSSNSLSNQSFDIDDPYNVTISDLYEGMMHSMSRLLSSKPSCIISTKTHINQNWSLGRRLYRKGEVHKNKTYCHWRKPFRKSSKRRPVPCSEPWKEARILRDCKNLLHIAPHKKGLKPGRVSLEGSKLQVHKFRPDWKDLQEMPQKSLDVNTTYLLERENRVKALQWLISPVKIVPRPRMIPSLAEKQRREIEIKFDQLHQECCLSSRKPLWLADPTESWAVDMYKGGSVSPGIPQGIETHRLSLPFNREKAKRLSEAFEDQSEMSVKADRCLQRSDPFPKLSEDSTSQKPGHCQQMSGLFLQEYKSGPIKMAASLGTAISAPWMGPQSCGRNRYDEIKKEFDILYQKYCLMSPQQVKVTSCVKVSPMKARATIPSQTEDLRKFNPDSQFQSLQKLSTSGQRIRSPQHSTALEAHGSLWTVVRDPCFPTKRRKLSYPSVCAYQANS
ncbi:Holliday junction recognition protein [Psammomys obesus]|uniref:Holliday junction recognition protein n=1 Tax=Psammomys obesus TaxID=48139 RepID=UPI002452E7D8|nr:Holliday junction recognition protein [Psammomys obesus]